MTRYLAAALCGIVGVLYLILLFLVADAESGASENTYGAYLLLAVPYLIGAGLLVTVDRRPLWIAGAAIQVVVIVLFVIFGAGMFGPGRGVFDYDVLSGLHMELWAAVITGAEAVLLGLLSYLAFTPQGVRHDVTVSGMSSPDVFLKYMAFAVMTLTGVLGWVFATRSALSDFETAQAVGSTAPWLVLAIALSAFAFWSRRIAPWAFVLLTAFAVIRSPVESASGLTDRDDPFAAIGVLVLGVALGFLALHHTRLAGALLAALGVGQLVAVFVSADRGDAVLGELLTTSSGAVIAPILVVAGLLLAADAFDRGHRAEACAKVDPGI